MTVAELREKISIELEMMKGGLERVEPVYSSFAHAVSDYSATLIG